VEFLEEPGDLFLRAPRSAVGHVHARSLHMAGAVDRWGWADGYDRWGWADGYVHWRGACGQSQRDRVHAY
jgi:hypothetical protein